MHAPQHMNPSVGLVLLLGALTAFAALSIDLYLPSLPTITRDFAIDPAETQHTVSAFFLGLALGQFFYGPLSDRIGRRRPLLGGIALYVIASLICVFAVSIEMLVAGRFLQALGGCAGMVVARAVVRDRFDHTETARIMSLLTLVMGVAPILAPMLGGLLLSVTTWRAIFAVLCGFGVLVGLSVYFNLPESRPEAVALHARSETPLKSYAALLKQPRLLGYLLSGALNGACLFTYIAGSPDLIIGTYGIAPTDFGWIFGLNAAGLISASQVNRALLRHHSSDRILATASLVSVGFGVLLLAGATSGIAGMWGVLVPLFLVLATYGFMGANTIAGALSVDPLRAGSISALIGGTGFGVGAIAATIAGAFHDGTAWPMAFVMALSLVGAATALFTLALPRRVRGTD